MLECYNSVDQTKYPNREAATNICVREREKVKDIIKSNQLNMTTVLTDRMNLLLKADRERENMRTVSRDDQYGILR